MLTRTLSVCFLFAGETPLHVAAFNGDLDMCKYIMDSIDNKSPKSNDGVTPLHFAARTGHLNICKYIIEEVGENVQRDIRKQFPLHWAAYGGNLDVFIYLFGIAEDKNPMGNFGITPLDLAVKNGHLSVCKYTMEHAKDLRTHTIAESYVSGIADDEFRTHADFRSFFRSNLRDKKGLTRRLLRYPVELIERRNLLKTYI